MALHSFGSQVADEAALPWFLEMFRSI